MPEEPVGGGDLQDPLVSRRCLVNCTEDVAARSWRPGRSAACDHETAIRLNAGISVAVDDRDSIF